MMLDVIWLTIEHYLIYKISLYRVAHK